MNRIELCEGGLVRVSEVAATLGLSRSTVYSLMDSGRLAYVLIGRSRRIPRKAITELAARCLIGGDANPE